MRGNKITPLEIILIIAITIGSFALLTIWATGKEVEETTTSTVLATSQENEETSTVEGNNVIEKARPTGNIALDNVGMAATVDKFAESIAATCEWNNYIELTQSELELLYTTVYCESGDQELEAQIMVAQTIINRIISDKYPDTLRGVVYQRNSEGVPQFAVINWTNFENIGWSDETKTAVHYALAHKGYPETMLYFRDSYYHDFGQPYKNVDDMYFSLTE